VATTPLRVLAEIISKPAEPMLDIEHSQLEAVALERNEDRS
jgi:hypothetical protein